MFYSLLLELANVEYGISTKECKVNIHLTLSEVYFFCYLDAKFGSKSLIRGQIVFLDLAPMLELNPASRLKLLGPEAAGNPFCRIQPVNDCTYVNMGGNRGVNHSWLFIIPAVCMK